ncbi:hypothetical protein AVEN_275300-1 [Araneus ventricosus]|uniref:RING-type domain-containing protein n=1 Tax=Araneus ventricosus TaxID=182803 RepID=A0A4Y2GEH5_ARAVE|nr:hypothetical protein AVEN_275300-1 [Araneus ventricosus]
MEGPCKSHNWSLRSPWATAPTPDSKEGCGKVAVSLSIGYPRKHFRANRFGNHCHKVYIGNLFMNYLTDKGTMESARKRKHSSVAAVESESSSMTTKTDPDMQTKRRKQSPFTGSDKNVKKDTSVQDPSTSGEGRTPSVDTSTGYECAICLESTRRRKMKSLPCSHAFHRACIDVWLKEGSRRCPICRQESEPPQNARPPTRNQRQMIFGDLQAFPGMRLVRPNNAGVDMRFNNGGFIRINNGGIHMRNVGFMVLNNGGTTIQNNGGIEMRLDNNGFMILNNGGIRFNNINI